MTVTLAELEKRVAALEAAPKSTSDDSNTRKEVRRVSDALEDVLDHVYGTNVRPPVRQRSDDEYPAEVVPTLADEGTDQYKKDVNG